MNGPTVLLLAGGVGSRLNVLARKRAKPAVPFGGIYRIIDFTLSNLANSGLDRVGVLTQYRPSSLMDHLGQGESWDLAGRTRILKILPPFIGHDHGDWYRGTADAVYQNRAFLDRFPSSDVLIVSGDHIYTMSYEPMIDFHRQKSADLTIAVMTVAPSEVTRFGILGADETGRVRKFWEKPKEPCGTLASMGIYLFRRAVLDQALEETVGGRAEFDFGAHVIPSLSGRIRVFAYPFEGYWRDVGTIQSYWEANMDLLSPGSGIDIAKWNVRTNLYDRGLVDRSPAFIGPRARPVNSIISRGCTVLGTVESSILSPGVFLGEEARVRGSILMHDSRIEAGAELDRAILDKDVVVGPGARVGVGTADRANLRFPTHLDTGLTVVGKAARIPEGTEIGRNCLIYPSVGPEDFPGQRLGVGETVDQPESSRSAR